ncbi:MAG TPA: hypothetical protein VN738_03360 [Acidothermaceae bacterium]|nr:hypothetical protein [Acidothermaceae bacterium]
MRVMSGLVAAVLVGSAIAGTTAMSRDHDNNHKIFNQDLVGLPAAQKIAIDGVPAAGAPWTVGKVNEVSISSRGDLKLDVKGLLITGTGGPNDGTTGPVTQVIATLACANGDQSSTSAVPLKSDGDAKIRDRITIPTDCLAPVVLVRIFGIAPTNPWIAATGL